MLRVSAVRSRIRTAIFPVAALPGYVLAIAYLDPDRAP